MWRCNIAKKFSIDVVLHTLKKNKGESPQYRIYNNHPAIIPKATWEYVQELYAVKFKNNLYPLSNKIECGLYHSPYMPNLRDRTKDYGRKLLYWICYSRTNGDCKSVLIHDEQLSEASTLAFEYLYNNYIEQILSDLDSLAVKILPSKAKQKEFNKTISTINPLNNEIVDYFTKFLVRKIYVVDNNYLLYEFIDDTLFKYELGVWSIRKNSKIQSKRNKFKNQDYWGKKPDGY